ncbi:MAG: hypothetical protein K1V80_08675 [Muribaculaceae bacterium]
MNKLQLYIYKSLRGFKSIRNFNPSENVQRHIHDLSNALECIDYNPDEKNLFYILSYIDLGAFFTIIRTIPDKPLNHLATTIFVPTGMIITREEMAAVVKRTTRMISNPSVSDTDVAELHEMFSKEYPVATDVAAAVASEGREYAVCYYGEGTPHALEDFFAEHLYQPEYLKFAGVVLVDAALGINCNAPDLTDVRIADNVPLLPPPADPDGFSPYLYRHVFDRPFYVPLGGEVEIVWRRGGFEDKKQFITVDEANLQVETMSTADSRKTISTSSFYITSHVSKNVVQDATITVNGIEINEPKSFTLQELKRAEVNITAPGYASFRGTLDLAATTQALIQLQEPRKIYRFELPVKSSELGAPIHFEIHTKREISASPIEGYSLLDEIREGQGRSNHLAYTGGAGGAASWRNYAIGAAAGLILGLLLGWLLPGCDSENKDTEPDVISQLEEVAVNSDSDSKPAATAAKSAETPDKKEDKDNKKKEEPAATASSGVNNAPVSAQAITYLDTHEVWTRQDLEKFPELRGLFADMNNFRLTTLEKDWGKKLSKSKRFSKVAHHAGEGFRKKVFKPEGTYCKGESDNSIKVQSYLNRVDPAKTK